MKMNFYKEESKKEWYTELPDGEKLPPDKLTLGCTMRIADAVEKIAMNHDSLINERDRYKRWYEQERDRCKRLEKSNAGLKGVITKLRKNK